VHRRKGIVLMMTLGFIAVITALILWSVSISKSRFDKVVAIDNENQVSIIFKDFISLITKFDINSSDSLALFLSLDLPPLAEEKTHIGLGFHSQSLMDKLNINYILSSLVEHETNTTGAYQDIYLRRPLEKFFAKFQLSDPFTMIDLLLDSIDKDDIERSGFSEIVSQEFDFRQGKIYSFEHFKKIRDYYYKSTRDENIFKITKEDFESYFYFGEPKERLLLDCSSLYIEKAMSLLIEDEMVITSESDFCEEAKMPQMKTLKEIYNISQFENKKKYLVKCILNIDTENVLREISFEYDVSTKRISNIDKNFQE
jgi:hypothetical protein